MQRMLSLRIPMPGSWDTAYRRLHRRWTKLSDLCFEALYHLLMQSGRLGTYAPLDDAESTIERRMRQHAARCGCRCCAIHIAWLNEADALDQSQRQLVLLAIDDNHQAAAPVRTLNGVLDGALVRESSYRKEVAA